MKIDAERKKLMEKTFSRNLLKFARISGPNIINRAQGYSEWRQAFIDSGLLEFLKSIESQPEPETLITNYYGEECRGINYGNQDYLSLSSHPAVKEAAMEALQEFGPHSAGSGPLQGNTPQTRLLEERLAAMLKGEAAVLYPSGWSAGYGVVAGIVNPRDHILIDELSHNCLRQGAQAATKKINNYKHLNVDMVEDQLKGIRADDTNNGILVISEGLFSMDSDVPNVKKLQEVCTKYNATLLLDIAHDFGGTGPGGLGTMGIQDIVGEVDLVNGAYSKTFASNGGFVVSKSAAVIDYLRSYSGPYTFSNMLSPVQAAVVNKGLDIVQSQEGEELRQKSLHHSTYLRKLLTEKGLTCIGKPSPIVPVMIGDERVALLANTILFNKGVAANTIEFPGVARGKARYRIQVMANHEDRHADIASQKILESINEAQELVDTHFSGE